MLTHGNLTRVIEYLFWLRSGRVRTLHEFQLLSRCTGAERLWVERFCDACRLTRVSHDVAEELTSNGSKIADAYGSSADEQRAFQVVLEQYIRNCRPGWANRMPVGRQETFASLSRDELFCFRKAGIASGDISNSVVEWWDRVASDFRSQRERDLLDIGRRGERLTLEYECKRTGVTPKWTSVETNFAGYDILSVDDASSCALRKIEVKASLKPLEIAAFSVSRNEWETAQCDPDRYYFYLWLLGPLNRVAVIGAADIIPHIAVNQGLGQWANIEIPYSTFSARFENGNV